MRRAREIIERENSKRGVIMLSTRVSGELSVCHGLSLVAPEKLKEYVNSTHDKLKFVGHEFTSM